MVGVIRTWSCARIGTASSRRFKDLLCFLFGEQMAFQESPSVFVDGWKIGKTLMQVVYLSHLQPRNGKSDATCHSALFEELPDASDHHQHDIFWQRGIYCFNLREVSPRNDFILCIYLVVCCLFSHILHIISTYIYIYVLDMQRRSLHVWHVLPLMTLCRIPSFQDETPMSISHAPMEGLNLNLHLVRCPSQIFSPQNDGWWWLVKTASCFIYLGYLDW